MAELPREVADAARRFADALGARAAQAPVGSFFAPVTAVAASTVQITRRGRAITARRGVHYTPAVGDWVLVVDIDSQPVVIQAMKS